MTSLRRLGRFIGTSFLRRSRMASAGGMDSGRRLGLAVLGGWRGRFKAVRGTARIAPMAPDEKMVKQVVEGQKGPSVLRYRGFCKGACEHICVTGPRGGVRCA
jgi:hypothetical protein